MNMRRYTLGYTIGDEAHTCVIEAETERKSWNQFKKITDSDGYRTKDGKRVNITSFHLSFFRKETV